MVYYTWQDMIDAIMAIEYVYHLTPNNIVDLIFMLEHENFAGPMQYTGKTDMNNQDIYEGDIIYKELNAPDDPAYGHYGAIGVVKEDEHDMGWRIDALDTGDRSFYDYMGVNFSFDEIKVIGNIHDNPDLTE